MDVFEAKEALKLMLDGCDVIDADGVVYEYCISPPTSHSIQAQAENKQPARYKIESFLTWNKIYSIYRDYRKDPTPKCSKCNDTGYLNQGEHCACKFNCQEKKTITELEYLKSIDLTLGGIWEMLQRLSLEKK